MKYINENKEILFKYILIIISNLLVCILCNFYFKESMYKDMYMLLINIVLDLIIYLYKGTKKFIYYMDFITNFIIGLILMFFIKDKLSYATILFSLFFANNIIFIRSKLSNKFFIKILQYLLMFIITMINLFINLSLYNIIF